MRCTCQIKPHIPRTMQVKYVTKKPWGNKIKKISDHRTLNSVRRDVEGALLRTDINEKVVGNKFFGRKKKEKK